MKQPIIGITGNERPFPEDETVNMSYTSTGFVRGVQKAGGLPLIIPIDLPEHAINYVSMIDKLIVTGGQNVLPKFYGEEQSIDSDDYLEKRDLFEIALIEEAQKQGKPIFTVCRGTQLYNVVMGGKLFQSIPDHWQNQSGDIATQDVLIEEDSLLSKFYGTKAHVNSFHRQALSQLGQGLKVTAQAEDGIIEAIESSQGYPYIGIQWHPELLVENSPQDCALFEYVVKEL